MPPPTGVVSGPLMADQVRLERVDRVVRQPFAVRVVDAFSPASTSNHTILARPPYAF